MSRQIPNVRTWSKTVPPYLFDLADLDVYVLKEHPDLVAAMGRQRHVDRRERGDLGVLALLFLAPLAAVCAWGGRLPNGIVSNGLGRSTAADFAGWCFTAALLGPPLVVWRWRRRQRHRDLLEVVGLVVSLLAGIATLGLLADDSGVDVLAPERQAVPVWLDVVAAAVVAGLVTVSSRGRAVDFGRNFRVVGPADTDQVRRLLGRLEPRRREKLLDERRRVVGRLRDRGLVDDRQATEVAALPLGWSPTLRGAGDRPAEP